MVCKLKKALYGVKQAPRAWYTRLDKYLAQLRFIKGTIENKLYLKEFEKGLLIIVIFFDDIIFGGDDDASDKFVDEMKKEFEMNVICETKYFQVLQLVKNNEGIFILQSMYLKDFLKRFGLESYKPIGRPVIVGHKLSSKDETIKIEQKQYRSMIGGL